MCYEQQADSHEKMAENLTKSASMFEEQEAQTVQRLKRISDDSQ
jgi:hypothetical protein